MTTARVEAFSEQFPSIRWSYLPLRGLIGFQADDDGRYPLPAYPPLGHLVLSALPSLRRSYQPPIVSERLCTKSRVEMEVFPLRPSAYLCVLCVNGPFNAESRRDTQRPQRKQIRFATFCAKPFRDVFIFLTRRQTASTRDLPQR